MTKQQASVVTWCAYFVAITVVAWFFIWSQVQVELRAYRDAGIAHREAELLELNRINNMLELQYHEMVWEDDTFEAYCEENPEGCEVLR